jgi:hypothetical protein
MNWLVGFVVIIGVVLVAVMIVVSVYIGKKIADPIINAAG